ncbi:uncharacterized protein [Vicugna pacos]|uniref:Uncharacterized protein n=1 Tax=Vicugna pacos TaxID=30538 RepID=A0ABM5DNI0_VICPA
MPVNPSSWKQNPVPVAQTIFVDSIALERELGFLRSETIRTEKKRAFVIKRALVTLVKLLQLFDVREKPGWSGSVETSRGGARRACADAQKRGCEAAALRPERVGAGGSRVLLDQPLRRNAAWGLDCRLLSPTLMLPSRSGMAEDPTRASALRSGGGGARRARADAQTGGCEAAALRPERVGAGGSRVLLDQPLRRNAAWGLDRRFLSPTLLLLPSS